jgi:hypothetical protein
MTIDSGLSLLQSMHQGMMSHVSSSSRRQLTSKPGQPVSTTPAHSLENVSKKPVRISG